MLLIRFLTGLIGYYALNIGTWAAVVMGVSYFLGIYDEVYAFFQHNRVFSASALLLHFAICCIMYHASDTYRLSRRALKILRDKDPIE